MNYYIDQEFQEGFHKPLFGKRRHFIDLISIGIVAEDGREYYAVSNEFDLKAVWNKYDEKLPDEMGDAPIRIYWLRENVLRAIWEGLCKRYIADAKATWQKHIYSSLKAQKFSIAGLKMLLRMYGKSNNQIAQEVIKFTTPLAYDPITSGELGYTPINFYGYYSSYDWVLFCSLFGRMIDLPDGYPMYCHDLKQMLDQMLEDRNFFPGFIVQLQEEERNGNRPNLGKRLKLIKSREDYPKQTDEHNALADARWNQALHAFIIHEENKQEELRDLVNSISFNTTNTTNYGM